MMKLFGISVRLVVPVMALLLGGNTAGAASATAHPAVGGIPVDFLLFGLVLLGVALLSAGEHSAAIEEFQAVIERDTDHKSAQMYLKIAQTQQRNSVHPPA